MKKIKGVTFIELVVSLFILILCIGYVYSVFIKGIDFYYKVKVIYPAYNACASKMEEILAMDSLDSLLSLPPTGTIINAKKEYNYTVDVVKEFDGNPKLYKFTLVIKGPNSGKYHTTVKLTALKAVK